MNTFNLSPNLPLFAIMKKDYVQTFLINVTVKLYVPAGCLGASPQCSLQKAIKLNAVTVQLLLFNDIYTVSAVRQLIIKSYGDN